MSYIYQKVDLVAPISDVEMSNMLDVMRPAYRVADNWYREIRIDGNGFDPRTSVLTWSHELIGPKFTAGGLGITMIPSFHRFAAPSLFKPSLAEVLGAINRYCLDWSTVRYFALNTGSLSSANCIGSTWHWTTCFLITEPLELGKPNEFGGHELVPLNGGDAAMDP